MNRASLLVLALLVGCGPGSVVSESTTSETTASTSESPESTSENPGSTSNPGSSETGSTDTIGDETGECPPVEDTGEPLPPPPQTCVGTVFALENIPEFESSFLQPASIVARADGSIVTVHPTEPDVDAGFHFRAWSSDGELIWDNLFSALDESYPNSVLEADGVGDLYLGYSEWEPMPAFLTKFPGDGGAETWTYEYELMEWSFGSTDRVDEMRFDGDGKLLVAMTLNNFDTDTDVVVQTLDPQSGMALDWQVQWDGPNESEMGYTFSYDSVGGVAVDLESGRVFVAVNTDTSNGIRTVAAYDPPSTSPVWTSCDLGELDYDWIQGMELTASGKLVVLMRRFVDQNTYTSAPYMVALDPDDGSVIWSADASELGFGETTEGLAMVATPDGGVAVSGYFTSGPDEGFLLRLDADLNPHCLDGANLGLSDANVLIDVTVDSSGNIHSTGWAYAPGGNAFDFRPLVVRWD